MKIFPALLMASTLTLAACSRDEQMVGADGETFDTFYAVDAGGNPADPLRSELGRLFLVEHPRVQIEKSMKQAIASHPPGGILFWNQGGSTAESVRSTVAGYSKLAKASGRKPLLFSVDYEGGGLSKSPTGSSVPGIQRFKDGMTKLAHPIWLGHIERTYGMEGCQLHGQIMAQELKSIGINYPLSTVADLATGLFALRGVSKRPAEVAACLEEILISFQYVGHVVFVTKHFPGLGSVRGDTHDGDSISRITDRQSFEPHLKPFKDLIQSAASFGSSPLLSFLASHAKYPALDPDRLTTESPTILTDILRNEMKFQGVVVSDAMWMGHYGSLGTSTLMVVYLKSVLSGMDLLMIPGSKFAAAMSFFRGVYDGTSDEDTIERIETATGLTYSRVRTLLVARLKQSLARLSKTQNAIGYAHDYQGTGKPSDETAALTERYNELLKGVGHSLN